MTAAIRRLGLDDVAAARALNALFADAFEDPARDTGMPPEDGWIAGLLARPDMIMLAAVAGGAVVGGLTAYALPKLERATSEIYLYDIAVAAGWRRQGIATRLIRDLEAIARELGAATLYVQADRDDGPAIALYQGLGRGAEVVHFDLMPETD